MSSEADRYRAKKLCPYNNKVPNCTKDKANDPLGVCSVFDNDHLAVTCPIRFRQNWIIADEAADFFFPTGAKWTSLTEVRLKDKNGKSAGNIDLVIVSYDDHGKVIDFGALEVQAVYISGNVRNPFEHYMNDPKNRAEMNWRGQPNYPKPDYFSSSRKQVTPQLICEGGILSSWRKKTAVVLGQNSFDALPTTPEVAREDAEIAWLIFDVDSSVFDATQNLVIRRTVYTRRPALPSGLAIVEGETEKEFLSRIEEELWRIAV